MSSRLASLVATALLVLSVLALLGAQALVAHTPAAIAVQFAAAALMFWAGGPLSFAASTRPHVLAPRAATVGSRI